MIKLSHVCKSFGLNEVLKDVNLDVQEGEKLVIIGPSGSGKSTTVRCMNGLELPTSGQVLIDGEELTKKTGFSLCGTVLPWCSSSSTCIRTSRCWAI